MAFENMDASRRALLAGVAAAALKTLRRTFDGRRAPEPFARPLR